MSFFTFVIVFFVEAKLTLLVLFFKIGIADEELRGCRSTFVFSSN